jgi:Domain of unknown function (DUF397)
VDIQQTDLAHAIWHKSARSNNGGACVEVASNLPGVVAVRDSKDRNGPALGFTPDEWRAFVSGVKSGEFDLA